MMRILCLWLPNWPIQRLVRARPELERRAVVLEESDARGGRVAACCARAAAAGVRPEMPVAEARSLAPELIVAPYDAAADRRALERLAEACERFSPCVALEEGDEPESLLLDITNLAHLWGSEPELAERVAKFFTRQGYRARLAVADTVGLAWAVAHFGEGDCQLPIAKCQLSIGRSGRETLDQFAICNSLPVEALRISEETMELLRQLGIETIGQLLPLPREGLATRFGDELLRRLDQLTGAAREAIAPHRARAPLAVEQALEQPTADRAVLTHVLGQLAERLARELATRDQGAVLLICLLQCAGGETVRLRIGLLQPSASARQWMELVELHLENLILADEVAGVEIRVAMAGRLGQRQGELFAGEWSMDPHQLAVLVNRLSSRLGYEQVLRPELRASAAPERGVCYISATGQRTKKLPIAKCKLRSSSRPLLLYPKPQALDVVCVAPDGPPQLVWREGRRERVARHWGPERIETLWWRGRSVRRDYYRVAIESGGQLWMFRRLRDGRWFLHGVFA